MVTVKLIAQTGNQLFMIAATMATALRNGDKYLIPRETSSRRLWPCYIQHLPEYKGEEISGVYYEPKDFTYQPIPYTPNMQLSGYFQTELHFKDYREQILQALGFSWHKLSGTVSIHVRRGDYLRMQHKHPPVTKNYVVEAMHHFNGARFIMFSDDIQWCENEFKEYKNNITFIGGEPIEDLQIMSCCEHNIISNSTFSWWGAWLNQNPDKIVIAPKNWFGVGNSHLKSDWIVPENWIKI